jgi:hypothetical protein
MLSPNTAAITSQVTSDYRVNNYMMAWAHTLMNTTLFPLNPKPAWYDGVATELAATKTTTQEWLTKDFSDIAAALPQTLISYANLFGPGVDEMVPLVTGKNPKGTDRETVADVLEALHAAAVKHHFRVRGLQNKMIAFAKVAQASSKKMIDNAKEVRKTIGEADKDLLALQGRVAELQRRLGITTTEAKNSMTGAAMTGASITMTMLAFTVGAASFPIFGLAGAIIGIGIKAAQEAAQSKEVLALIREIGELQSKVSAQQFQMAAMETIAASFENLSDICTEALTSMEGSVHHWDDIVNNLAAAQELVAHAEVDLSTINAFKELRNAATNWATIGDRARKIQGSLMRVTEPIIVGSAA